MDDEGSDRAAILARRAVFVATALATSGLGGAAHAEQAELVVPCPPRDPPTPEALVRARARVDDAIARAEFDRRGAALELEAAYDIAPSAATAAAVIDLLASLGALTTAHRVGERELSCGGPSEQVEARVRDIERTTAHLRVFLSPGPGQSLAIDGEAVSVEDAKRGLRLLPGPHRLTHATSHGGEQARDLDLLVGQTTVVELTEPPPPMPCLNFAEPGGDGVRDPWEVHFGFAAPAVAVGFEPGGERPVMGGGGPRLSMTARLAENLWFEGDIFAIAAYGDGRLLDLGGTTVSLRYHPGGVYGFGAGFTGGLANQWLDGVEDPRRDGFFGPVVIPASFALGETVQIEARVPIWFSASFEGEPRHPLSLGLVAPHFVMSYVLGGDEIDLD